MEVGLTQGSGECKMLPFVDTGVTEPNKGNRNTATPVVHGKEVARIQESRAGEGWGYSMLMVLL